MKNKTDKFCSCPHCESELKNGCFSPEFCRPCCARTNDVLQNNVKICKVCGARYLPEYDECPSCAADKK